MTVTEINIKTNKRVTRPQTKKEKKRHEEVLEEYLKDNPEYIEGRIKEYLPLGDNADIAYKQRQKQRMLVGKARKAYENGDKDNAFVFLMEAVEPVEDAKDYDAHTGKVKQKYPKKEEK
jgi:hypothetical protein